MTTGGKVLFLAGDPGGAVVLLQVIKAWQGDSVILAYRQAVQIFRDAGLEVTALDGDAVSTEAANGWLQRLRPALVFPATSINGVDWELRFFVAARSAGIPTLSVMDYWSNYAQRFTLEHPLDAMPDAVAIMDERARTEMMADGFPADHLVVTGQPVLDLARQWRAGLKEESRDCFRAALGLQPGQQAILFISQPLREMHQATRLPHENMHDEFSALRMLVAALAAEPADDRVLLVKLHPRDPLDKVDTLLQDLPLTARLVSPAVHRWEVCVAADHVFGVSSMLLEEAIVMNCPVRRIEQDSVRLLDAVRPSFPPPYASPLLPATTRITDLIALHLGGMVPSARAVDGVADGSQS